MSGLDEVSRVIGELQGNVANLQLSHTSTNRAIFDKLDIIQAEQVTQKVDASKVSVKMSLITAIVVFGFVEGVRYYIKTGVT